MDRYVVRDRYVTSYAQLIVLWRARVDCKCEAVFTPRRVACNCEAVFTPLRVACKCEAVFTPLRVCVCVRVRGGVGQAFLPRRAQTHTSTRTKGLRRRAAATERKG